MEIASRIASKTGCRLLNGTFPARVDGGPGRVSVERLPYFPEQILAALKDTEHLILVGGEIPASFFAYRGIPGQMVPEDCKVSRLSFIEEDSCEALQRVAERVGAMQSEVTRFQKADIGRPTGELDHKSTIQAIAATMPEDVIVCTDSGGGNAAYPFCQNTVPNSWLSLTGGAIGQGGPCATGAALAARPACAGLTGRWWSRLHNQCLWTR